MSKFILIDGVDGCGKSTQVDMLVEYLNEKYNGKCVTIHFPNYKSESSGPARAYLAGGIPNDTNNILAISSLFTVDMYCTYMTNLKKYFDDPDMFIIMDRWILSSVVYQTLNCDHHSKFTMQKAIYDMAINTYHLPQPDLTIILDMDGQFAVDNIKLRQQKSNSTNTDVHEENDDIIIRAADEYRLQGNFPVACHCYADNMDDIQNNSVKLVKVDIGRMTHDYKMKPATRIHSQIVNIVNEYFNLK